jgi:hypothetical protein
VHSEQALTNRMELLRFPPLSGGAHAGKVFLAMPTEISSQEYPRLID